MKLGIFSAALAAITFIASASAAGAEIRRYDWLTIGEPSGELIVEEGDDGAVSMQFSFNDRGRGPEIEADYVLNEDGVPISITITGLTYAKGDASETFSMEDGVARWNAGAISGEKAVTTTSLYTLTLSGIPEHTAIMARVLLDAPDRTLPTLPAGEMRIEELESAAFPSSDGDVNATLYALYTEGPYPTYIWLDEDLNLFGADYGWFAIAPEGMASAMPIMKERQTAATNERTASLSESFRHNASGLVVITNARLFDSLTGEVHRRSTIFVQDGVIAAVYHERVDAPEDAIVIDAKGKMVLPALWDMHAHVGTNNLFNYISAGVLNIRDMANDPDYIIQLKRDLANRDIAGPDVHAMGFIDKRSPYAAPTGMLADTLDEALEFVDWYAQRGFRGIKLYSSIEPDWVEPIAERAHAHGLTVLGHIPAYMTAEQAIRAGYDEITHVNMLFLNFMNAEEIDTRTPQRFIVPAREGGNLDLDSAEVEDFINLMVEQGIAHDPTHTIFQGTFLETPGDILVEAANFYDHLPQSQQSGLIAGEGFNKGIEEEGARTAAVARDLIRKLHGKGVRVLPGTDAGFPGFVLLRELELFGDAGIPANEVLQLATIESARHLGLDQSLGSISPNKKAHLIIVDGDPIKDLADLYKVDTIIKGSDMFKPAEIHEAFNIKSFD
ncbi:amidohydrolase family protein [Hyphococcus flavus]|uniref:Amidohydrolase family protein n=1 Tax=Hyphococcus flavus TaxID=1866326 RepID=A0AAE9ZAN1_9PROT|nr:amidohydrolase family protein [Hyphococcus flavus]WDI30754.1 amidohydrolase family protein [Hyphococcus flavus]